MSASPIEERSSAVSLDAQDAYRPRPDLGHRGFRIGLQRRLGVILKLSILAELHRYRADGVLRYRTNSSFVFGPKLTPSWMIARRTEQVAREEALTWG